jgi:hypothetical protein
VLVVYSYGSDNQTCWLSFLLPTQRTDSTEQRSQESFRFKKTRLLWKLKVHYRKTPPLDSLPIHINPAHVLTQYYLRSTLMLSSHQYLYLPNALSFRFFNNILQAFPISPMLYESCSTHRLQPDKTWWPTLFSIILKLCSFIRARDQTSHPYKTVDKITVLFRLYTCILKTGTQTILNLMVAIITEFDLLFISMSVNLFISVKNIILIYSSS